MCATQADSVCHVTAQSDLAGLLRAANLFVWDEAPMMDRRCFEAVDRLLQDLTGTNLPMGGKMFLMSGVTGIPRCYWMVHCVRLVSLNQPHHTQLQAIFGSACPLSRALIAPPS